MEAFLYNTWVPAFAMTKTFNDTRGHIAKVQHGVSLANRGLQFKKAGFFDCFQILTVDLFYAKDRFKAMTAAFSNIWISANTQRRKSSTINL